MEGPEYRLAPGGLSHAVLLLLAPPFGWDIRHLGGTFVRSYRRHSDRGWWEDWYIPLSRAQVGFADGGPDLRLKWLELTSLFPHAHYSCGSPSSESVFETKGKHWKGGPDSFVFMSFCLALWNAIAFHWKRCWHMFCVPVSKVEASLEWLKSRSFYVTQPAVYATGNWGPSPETRIENFKRKYICVCVCVIWIVL